MSTGHEPRGIRGLGRRGPSTPLAAAVSSPSGPPGGQAPPRRPQDPLRPRWLGVLFASLLLACGAARCGAQTAFDWGWQTTSPRGVAAIENFYLESIQQEHTGSIPSRLITAYRTHVAPKQGPRCLCLPSCSVFTLYAMNRYGPVIGFIMGMDRLYFRENLDLGHRLHYLPVLDSKGDMKVYDPPEADNIFEKHDWRIIHPGYDLERIVQLRERSGPADGGGSEAPRGPAR